MLGRFHIVAPVYFAILVLAVFGGGMLFGGGKIFSAYSQDLNLMMVPFLKFGFQELARWNLALWNPHSLCGTPFLGNFQTALLYPPNWLHLIFPTSFAINSSVAIHFFLAGWFTSLWCRRRGLGIIACLIGGTTFMFCAGFFLHLYPGHLAFLDAMTWTPLIFLVVDAVLDRPTLAWMLCGVGAVAMSIFAGHPQTVYYTALIVGFFVTMRLLLEQMSLRWRIAGVTAAALFVIVLIGQSIHEQLADKHARWLLLAMIPAGLFLLARAAALLRRNWKLWLRTVVALAAIYFGGAMIAAIQIGPGWNAAQESSRAGGVTREFARVGALPPEGLLTLISPHVFGSPEGEVRITDPRKDVDDAKLGKKEVPYIGRGGFWEVTLFVGVVPLLLAAFGAVRGQRGHRRFAALLAGITIILAMGYYLSPLFDPMFKHVPGYGEQRVTGRFNFLFGIFIAMLAASGWDALVAATSAQRKRWGTGGLAAGLAVVVSGIWLAAESGDPADSAWGRRYVTWLFDRDAKLLAELIIHTGRNAGHAIALGGVTLLAAALCILATGWNHRWRFAVAALLLIELLIFAWTDSPMTVVELPYPAPWEEAVAKRPPDSRIFTNTYEFANWGLLRGWDDLYGYDPIILKRYSDMFAQALGHDPDRQNFVPPGLPARGDIAYPPAAFRMLRMGVVCANIPIRTPQGIQVTRQWRVVKDPLPHVLLVHAAQVIPNRTERLATVVHPRFNPSRVVILEEAPPVPPDEKDEGGSAKALRETTDDLEIEVQTPTAAILLVTDSYSKHWIARGIGLSAGQTYRILPANHTLRAIALPAGTHHILMEYRPSGFVIGRIVTFASLTLYLLGTVWAVWRWWQNRTTRIAK